jgi:hypothetical protein
MHCGLRLANFGEGRASCVCKRLLSQRAQNERPVHAYVCAHSHAKGRTNMQDRKDREKEKRDKGQSTHSTWKSEAEMLLRQQYD